jgi:lysophospholipase L1-like esterase
MRRTTTTQTKRKDETKARLAFATRQPVRENMRLRKALLVIQIGIACFCISLSAASAQIVALGASNTAGYGLSSSQSWPAQLQAMLQAKGSDQSNQRWHQRRYKCRHIEPNWKWVRGS